jgi:hypothetical protein
MDGEAVHERARDIYDLRERIGGVTFRDSITWDEEGDDLSFSNDLACDLAFSDTNICLA